MPGLAHLAHKIAGASGIAGIDLAPLRSLRPLRVLFRKGEAIGSARDNQARVYLISSGWAYTARLLPNGGRQIIGFMLPGDFLGLSALIEDSPDISTEAATALTATVFDASSLTDMLQSRSPIGRVLLWSLVQEQSLIAEHLCSVGRRSAYERSVHLLLEIWLRLRLSEATTGSVYILPLTLNEVADALGLSEVHMSRTVHRIREQKLFDVDLVKHRVEVIDRVGAKNAAHFDPAYLKLDRVQWRELLSEPSH